ncbi:MAG: heme exporter protein CcmB [Saprospiraceae bacterium]|nr:heme exporter protein CcmB [Saprospiraceae bacterium]
MFRQSLALFKKDIHLDLRQRFGLGGILLYVFSASFIIYLTFGEMTPEEWIVLFWIVILFASVNAVLKSFAQEAKKRQLYYYTLCDPYAAIFSKMLYNFCVLVIITAVTWSLFSIVSPNPILTHQYFFLAAGLACAGIAANFTFVSAIAYRTRNQSTMMMVLSLPVIIPLLLPVIKISLKTLNDVSWRETKGDFSLLLSIDLLIVALIVFLFPYIWRE